MPEQNSPFEGGHPEQAGIVPPLPIQRHKTRQGEPAFPPRLALSPEQSGLQRSENRKQRDKWFRWTDSQPDARLLNWEYSFGELWRTAKGQVEPQDVAITVEDMKSEAQRLQEEGHGDIIATSWSHLVEEPTR